MSKPTSPSFPSSLPTYSSVSQSRLQSLYSDISRQKHSNAASYNAYVDWWHRSLEALLLQRWNIQHVQNEDYNGREMPNPDSQPNKLVLRARRDLMETFKLQGIGKPSGLGTVIAELSTKKALIPVSQFLSSSHSVYDSSWSPLKITSYVLGQPLWWALRQLDIVDSEESYHDGDMWKKAEGDYVVMSILERTADTIESKSLGRGVSIADRLFTIDGFKRLVSAELFSGVPPNDIDTKVLLKYLERDRKSIVRDDDVIKFLDSQDKRITTVDRGILELKSAVERLSAQVDHIQEKINQASQKTKTALQGGHKVIALSCLRTRKQLEDLLAKRLGSLDTLQSTMLRVEAAAGDIEIMKSYESSTVTLQTILAHPSLQRDKITETLDAMAAATADAHEVEDAIRLGGEMAAADAGLDDTEIEEELKQLVQDIEEEKLQAAPLPPTSVPTSKVESREELATERKPEPLAI